VNDQLEPFEVVVKPGFFATMASLVVVYAFFHVVNAGRAGIHASPAESLNWGASVTVLILFGTLLHELGHVAAGLAAGHRWTKAVLNGAGLGVVIEPRPHGWQRIVRSAAGPFVHLLFALVLLVVAALGSPIPVGAAAASTSVWWVAGVSTVFLGLLNALPLPGFDGAKIVAGIRDLRLGRRTLLSQPMKTS
jgi:Zn-dependent protease